MKLHLPKVLFTAVVAALACVQQAGATEYTVTKSASSNNFHDCTFADANGGAPSANGDVTQSTHSGTNDWRAFWRDTDGDPWGDHTIKFVDSAAAGTADATLTIGYDAFAVGAIIVGANSQIAGIKGSETDNNRNIYLGKQGGAYTSTFGRDFALTTKNIFLNGTHTWEIADSKTLSLNGNVTNNGSLTVDGTLSLASTLTNTGTLTVDGTLKISKTIATNDSGSIVLGEGGKVVVDDLSGFDSKLLGINYSTAVNGVQEIGAGYIIDKGSAATKLASVWYGGTEKTLTDGFLRESTEMIYVVVADEVTVGGDNTTAGTESVDGFAVGENGTLNIAGANNKLGVDTILSTTVGAGCIDLQSDATISNLSADFTGSLTISNGGNLTVTGNNALEGKTIKLTGQASTLTVSGASDRNGALKNADITMGEGTLLQKTSTNNWADTQQIKTLTLEGDATVDATYRFGLVSTDANARGTLALGGNTLTVKGNGGFILMHSDITGTGTIKLDGGQLHIGYSGAGGTTTVNATGTTLDFDARNGTGLSLEYSGTSMKVAAIKGGATGALINNAGSIELHGAGDYTLNAKLTGNGSFKLMGTAVQNYTYTAATLENNLVLENKQSTFEFASATEQTASGVISGEGKIRKSGDGTVNLSGANTYSGGTEITGGTVTAGSASALGQGKVTLSGGQLTQTTELTVTSLDAKGGSVNNAGHAFTVSGEMNVSADTTLTGTGANSVGSLSVSAGSTLETEGVLTIGTLSVTLSETLLAGQYQLVSSTGGSTISWSDVATAGNLASGLSYSIVGSLDTGAASLVSSGGSSSEGIWLLINGPSSDADSLLVSSASLSGSVLTLNIDANLTDVSSVDLILSEAALQSIAGQSGLVSLSLEAADGTFTTVETDGATLINNVSFYNGAYVGEGSGMYQIAYIPEPTTATLSLLALAGLAARRRRR